MKYDRTMRVDLDNKKLINALFNALNLSNGEWVFDGQLCKIVDIVRIERTNKVEIRLLKKVIK